PTPAPVCATSATRPTRQRLRVPRRQAPSTDAMAAAWRLAALRAYRTRRRAPGGHRRCPASAASDLFRDTSGERCERPAECQDFRLALETRETIGIVGERRGQDF